MGSFQSHLHLGRSVISIISVARFPSEITSKPITLKSFSSGSAFQCENGVSMVQGGSRGIGLEFVSFNPIALNLHFELFYREINIAY